MLTHRIFVDGLKKRTAIAKLRHEIDNSYIVFAVFFVTIAIGKECRIRLEKLYNNGKKAHHASILCFVYQGRKQLCGPNLLLLGNK